MEKAGREALYIRTQELREMIRAREYVVVSTRVSSSSAEAP